MRLLQVALELLKLIIAGVEDLRVALDKLREVAEEAVCRLEELELRVALLPLSQPLQELLAIPSNELRSQLDNVRVDISQDGRVLDRELVGRLRADVAQRAPLVRVSAEYDLLELLLVGVLTLHDRRCSLAYSSCLSSSCRRFLTILHTSRCGTP